MKRSLLKCVADIVLLERLLSDRAKNHVLSCSNLIELKSVNSLPHDSRERAGITISETINTYHPIPGIIYRFGRGTLCQRLEGGGSNVSAALIEAHRGNRR